MSEKKAPPCAILKLAPWQERSIFMPPGQVEESDIDEDLPTTEEIFEEDLEEILLEESSHTEDLTPEELDEHVENHSNHTSMIKGGWVIVEDD